MPRWKQIGQYQFYITFAEKYGWLPTEVDAQDPDIMDEIVAYLAGKAASEAKAPRPKKK